MEPTVKFKGGGSFVSKPPKFSLDSQTIFVAWNNVIVSYNIKTAKRLKEYRGLFAPVAGFEVLNINDVEHIAACSCSGEVIVWRTDIGLRISKLELFKDKNVAESFHQFHSSNIFLVSYRDSSRRINFGTVNIRTGKFYEINIPDLTRHGYYVAACKDSFFAVAQGRKLFFVRCQNTKQVYERTLDKGKYFTCIACHPYDDCVITGDSLGRVMLWYGFSSRDPTPGVYHWHTLPVRALTFSKSGTNFFSGGGECVLVKWSLDDPHWKKFLPRLSSVVEQIAVSEENQFIAVATDDNAIRILDSTFETVSLIQHLVLSKDFPAGIVYNNRMKSMVLNGLVGHLQFYSPNDMTLLYNLDVVGHNKLTQERNCPIENTVIKKIAFDSAGLWLATVEERKDDIYSNELRLKFWEFDLVKQSFQLNTSVELPHEGSITNVCFQPAYNKSSELRFVTTGTDGKFKIWQLVNADTVYRKGNAWTCTRVGFYRNLPCTALTFSSDGSLLAVGFGGTITAWLPDTCDLKCSLLHSTYKEDLTALHFGIANQCHLIVSTTRKRLSVWNLLTLTMNWTVSLQVSLLVANPLLPHMAVITSQNKVFVFHPSNPKPVFNHQLHELLGQVITACFVPGNSGSDKMDWCKDSQLYFINSKQELFCFDTETETEESIEVLRESLSNSLFSSTVPKVKSTDVRKVPPVKHLTTLSSNNKQLKQLLDTPVHTMIPLRLQCGSILRSFVLERKSPEVT